MQDKEKWTVVTVQVPHGDSQKIKDYAKELRVLDQARRIKKQRGK